MSATGIVALLAIILASGCTGTTTPSRTGVQQGEGVIVAPPQTDAAQRGTAAVEPVARPAPSPEVDAIRGGVVVVEPVVSPATPATTGPTGTSAAGTETSATKTETPGAKTSAKVPALPAAAAQVQKKEGAAPVTAKPGPPPLDLSSLEKRLRETEAIGAFTKLTLKNQVNGLLDQFRAYYQGRSKTTLAALREPYDLLLLKVLSLLQDSDPALASAIVASREAIWGILSDPVKFSKL